MTRTPRTSSGALKVTFEALFIPSYASTAYKKRRRELELERHVDIKEVSISGGSQEYWLVKQDWAVPPTPLAWFDFFEKTIDGLYMDTDWIQIGAVFSSAAVSIQRYFEDGLFGLNSIKSQDVDGTTFHYLLESGLGIVSPKDVGVFVTKPTYELNGARGSIKFSDLYDLCAVIDRYQKIFRAMKKLDQLKGAKDNTKMFDRLSRDVTRIVCSID